MFPLEDSLVRLSSTLHPDVVIIMMMMMIMGREAPLNALSVVLMDCSFDLVMAVFLALSSGCLNVFYSVIQHRTAPRPDGFSSRGFVKSFASPSLGDKHF